MQAEKLQTELIEYKKGSSSLQVKIIKLDKFMCVCEDCAEEFESNDKDVAYCDACWYHHENHDEEELQNECACLWGCDYCLGTEPRIGRD